MQHWHCAKSKLTLQRFKCARQFLPATSLSFHVIGNVVPVRSFATIIHTQNQPRQTDQALSTKVVVQPPSNNPSIDHRRAQLDQSLERLTVKDLSHLLTVTGRPLTGKKSDLTDRLATYLNSIAHRIDSLQSPSPSNYKRISPESSQEVPPVQKNKECFLNQIKGQVLPRSIISIDIGIRNLAWVELSRDGDILRWSIEDLLGSPDDDKAGSGTNVNTPTIPSTDEQTVAITDLEVVEGKPTTGNAASKRGGMTAVAKKSGRKSRAAAAFDQRSVAVRVDEMMRRVMATDAIEVVVVERQRFRTGGMHAILDAIFMCGVVEGMIHGWLAAWENNGRQRRIALHAKEDVNGNRDEETVIIESVSPNAVAHWWGIGASKTKSSKLKSMSNQSISESSETCKSDDDALQEESLQCVARSVQKTRAKAYSNKKAQSRNLVEKWIYNQDDVPDQNTFLGPRPLSAVAPARFQVRCSLEIKEWYRQEKKRDDLCDSVLQAVAWYEWRQRAIQEAAERSGIIQLTDTIVTEVGNPGKKKKKKAIQTKVGIATYEASI